MDDASFQVLRVGEGDPHEIPAIVAFEMLARWALEIPVEARIDRVEFGPKGLAKCYYDIGDDPMSAEANSPEGFEPAPFGWSVLPGDEPALLLRAYSFEPDAPPAEIWRDRPSQL